MANAETPLLRKARKLALESLENGLNAVDAKKLIKTKITLENSNLHAGIYTFNLDKFRNIYIVGGGKASGAMVEAIEEIFGNRITAGVVNVPYGDKHKANIIKLHGARHPVPDEAGAAGTRQMMVIIQQAGKDDLVVCLLSGGGSSLMPLPRDGVSLADKQALTDVLLKSGAKIDEINSIRKHVSVFKGGWLAKEAYPATVLNLILSDVVGDQLEFIASGPTVADSSTFADARNILEKYGLWKTAPASVCKVISAGEKGLIAETPKKGNTAFEKVYNVVLGNSRTAAESACQFLNSKGLNTLLLTATMEGEARHVGTVLASVANEIVASDNPVAIPAAVIVSGESTVTVVGKGLGGRNQEIALSAALKLGHDDGVAIASLSTDGVDGPTNAAGAIVDCKTLNRAERLGLEASVFLVENDSYNFFFQLGDLIVTGPTGTNVTDLSVIIVL